MYLTACPSAEAPIGSARFVLKANCGQAADFSGPDPHAAEFLGEAGLPHSAALRRGDGRWYFSPCHDLAFAWPAAVARGLCATVASAEGWALRRESEPAAALLPVPGDPEAGPFECSGDVSRKRARHRPRSHAARHPFRGRRLGE